jgi:hypothetical protein
MGTASHSDPAHDGTTWVTPTKYLHDPALRCGVTPTLSPQEQRVGLALMIGVGPRKIEALHRAIVGCMVASARQLRDVRGLRDTKNMGLNSFGVQ